MTRDVEFDRNQPFPNDSIRPNTLEPAPNSNPISGVWKLQYSVYGIIYESRLVMEGNYGKMLTSFYNTETGETETVEQTMKLEPSAEGMVLLGYNPVDPDTKERHPSYSPDNFLFSIDPYGNTEFYTCDDAGRCSPVKVLDYISINS